MIAIIITAMSCGSDNLSNSKAKKILNNCLESKPEQRFSYLKTGEVLISPSSEVSMEKFKNLEKLADDGYITMNLTTKKNAIWKEAKFYNVELTKKATEYIKKSSKTGGNITLNSHRYVVDEILEIHETPSYNIAKVKVQFKATDMTPFAILSSNSKKEFWTKTLKFTKTNDGWKHCDDY